MSECTKIRCLHKIGMCNGQLPPCAADVMEAAKTNTQQLKPEMPSFAKVSKGIKFPTLNAQYCAECVYNNIARHFGH